MKIGIVTPTTGNREELAGCWDSLSSVMGRVGAEWLWVVVGDGCEPPGVGGGSVTHRMGLPTRANDAGATPRAIGSAYAVGQGCEALFYLDDDNTFDATHITNAVHLAQQGAQVVTSRRWMVSAVTGERMYADEQDSDGMAFADTNTVALFGAAVQFGTTWAWFRQESGTDRVFWDRIRKSFMNRIACTGQPTVNYVTRWAPHYNVPGEDGQPLWQAPNPAKFVAQKPDGSRFALVAEPVWDGQRWVPVTGGES